MSTKPTDVRRLVAAITHENTGRSRRVCDSLQRHVAALAAGELDSRRLEKKLRIGRNAKCGREARQLGIELQLLGFRSRGLGFAKGQKPRIWFLRDDAQPPSKEAQRPSPFDSLTDEKRAVLECVSRCKLRLSKADWWDIARIVACVGKERTCTMAKIGTEIGRHRGTVEVKVRLGAKKRILKTRPVRDEEGRRATKIVVNWNRLEKASRGSGKPGTDLGPVYHRAPIHERLPSTNGDAGDDHQQVLDAVDWKKTDLKTESQWLVAKRLIPEIEKLPKARNADLAVVMGGCCDTSISNYCRQLRHVGILAQQKIYEVGATGAKAWRTVNWERLKACAGDQPTPSTNGRVTTNGDAAAAKHATPGGQPQPSTSGHKVPSGPTGVGRKRDWDAHASEAEKYRAQNPGASYRNALIFAVTTLGIAAPGDHKSLKAAIAYRRKLSASDR